ncbi:hypothetical protein EVAR_50806_1 [Eumeta japonica]|uniref:Uncharacterized protein n=1 Tax=Eumeta variegata TaxID=151549 RepID=A0A4C1XDD2_EUMVA|nr:hypothetical protein EVAR_50806_1 [Eumeta japonica]
MALTSFCSEAQFFVDKLLGYLSTHTVLVRAAGMGWRSKDILEQLWTNFALKLNFFGGARQNWSEVEARETDISQVIDLEEKLANAAQVIGEGMCAHSEESRLQAEASRVEAEALCLQTEALAKH